MLRVPAKTAGIPGGLIVQVDAVRRVVMETVVLEAPVNVDQDQPAKHMELTVLTPVARARKNVPVYKDATHRRRQQKWT